VSEVSKHFFFEKKKQKTFVSLGRGRELPAPLFSESSLLLFFKKPVLSSLALASVFSLTACSSSPPPAPIIYKPLDFSYLPPLTLRVASVNVQNTYVPGPDEATLIGEDPEAPANAISDLLNHRLIPSGAPGTANVTIETASLDESGGTLTGTMAVRVDVASADGRSTGYTEASISHREAAPDGNASQEDVRAALYDMTKTLTEDLNDRLQYQLEHDLSSWMVYGGSAGAAPVVSAWECAAAGEPAAGHLAARQRAGSFNRQWCLAMKLHPAMIGDAAFEPIAAEKIVAGEPRQRTWVSYEEAGGKLAAGQWEATPGKWRIAYAEWEYVVMIAGHSVIEGDDGSRIEAKAGDAFVIEPGFTGTWEVIETTRKHWVIEER
jgi:uncharacterized cupin superfamily protein